MLIITQIVDKNDPIMGFFHRWIEEFSRHKDLVVIALKVGTHDLPNNVRVLSLGKEDGVGRVIYVKRFFEYIWKYRNEYSDVFVHMNQIYVLLGGPLWILLGKHIGLWYLHKSVTWDLYLAEKLVDHIFTANKSSFRLESKKIHYVGHGIDTGLFSPGQRNTEGFTVFVWGRITERKNIAYIIDSLVGLERTSLKIAGVPVTEKDVLYLNSLKEKKTKNTVFLGPKTQKEIVDILRDSSVHVNLSETGSLDKTILESMSVGIPVITSNESATELFGPYKNNLFIEPTELASSIRSLMDTDIKKMGNYLRSVVIKDHNISRLIEKILLEFDLRHEK